MLNQCVLVGKVKEKPVVTTTSNGNKCATLLMDVERPFKNSNGEIELDTFKIFLWRGIADECSSIADIGSIIGVKGRLQSNNYDGKNDTKYYCAEVVAEKVSFLSNPTK